MVLLVIPVTVFLVQQQQNLQSNANPNTTLSFVPPDKTASVGEKVDFDVWISPGNNQVNFVKLVIKFDALKLSTQKDYFVLNPASNLSIIEGPIVGADGDTISVILSVENDPTKVIRADTKIGTISFDTLDVSDVPTQISFDNQQVQIRSINGANQDAFNENVFLNGTPANLTIQEGADVTPDPSVTLTPTVTGALTPTITAAATFTPNPTSTNSGEGAAPSTNQAPVCESLITDRSTDGTAPLSITFTATGNDTDGTISKVSFSFGDGTVEDVTTGGGIGTDTVNVQKSFTYNNANSFTASALMTDDNGGVSSDSTSCAVTVTVSDGDGSTVDSGGATVAPTGPTETIFGIGAIGGILFLVGALFFFAL